MNGSMIVDRMTYTGSPLFVEEATGADDTEGHSMGLLLGLLALEEADRASQRERDRHRPAEELKPITRAFPNLRRAAIAAAETAKAENDDAGTMAPGALPEPSTS